MNENQLPAKENMQVSLPQNELLSLYGSASTLKLSEEENVKILKSFGDDQIEIRPDGHIYLPQSYYRDRLNQAIGIGQWSLVPKGSHQEVNAGKTKLFLNGALVIRGCFVAEAVGEAELHATNENQSLATVWEAAKSDCITRCCKDLSIAQQIYQPSYVKQWQKDYAVEVWVKGKNKPLWRKKTAAPFKDETGSVDRNNPEDPMSSQRNPSGDLPWLNKLTKSGGHTKEWTESTEGLLNGTLTIEILKQNFKISKVAMLEIEGVAARAKELKPKSKYIIPGSFIAKLEKCRTKADVDQLAIDFMEDVKAHEELYNLFKETKAKLPVAESVKETC